MKKSDSPPGRYSLPPSRLRCWNTGVSCHAVNVRRNRMERSAVGIRGTWFYSRVGPQPLDCAGKRVKRTSEHHARHQGRMGGPQIGPPRAERPRPVPMVLSGSTSRTVYILLGILRSRVETTHPARLSSRTGIGARPGHLRPLRDRYDRGGAAASLFARPSARCPIGRVGPGETHAQEPLGCRPHPARGRGRRRVRPR